eukprot:TRINITY_DN6644_c0_g1_i1.p1 TRINITY_DN6644_c0_g1~~TRINITY_DN6644_c0_g1_i1.p1  ORF type:complete len:429 (+),score=87.28 TRINITY_DN6644_c0_g1_i1:205-1491(+)
MSDWWDDDIVEGEYDDEGGDETRDECVVQAIQGKYEILSDLGQGGFGVVRKVRALDGSESVFAMKEVNKCDANEFEAGSLEREVAIMKSLSDCSHVVQLHEVLDCETKLLLVMELLDGGEVLYSLSRSHGGDSSLEYTENDAIDVTRQLLLALRHMHEHRIIHRDIKPENLVFASTGDAKSLRLVDFGLSRVLTEGETLQRECGSSLFMAPEVDSVRQSHYGLAADLWSVGVVVYLLLCGYCPFDDTNSMRLKMKIRKGDVVYHSPYWDQVSPCARDFVGALLTVDPEQRLSATQALSHEWLTNEPRESAALVGVIKEVNKFRVIRRFRATVTAILSLARWMSSCDDDDAGTKNTEILRNILFDSKKRRVATQFRPLPSIPRRSPNHNRPLPAPPTCHLQQNPLARMVAAEKHRVLPPKRPPPPTPAP